MKGKRVKLSRKRQLQLRLAREKKRTREETTPEVENVDLPRASKRKLSPDSGQSPSGEQAAAATGTQDLLFVHVGQLNGLIDDLLCPDCGESKLTVEIGPGNQGFSANLVLRCGARGCAYYRSTFSSPRLQEESTAFDINVRMVLLAHELGTGYAALKKVSEVLGIPGIAHKTYIKHNNTVSAAEINRGLESLRKSREVVRRAYADTDPHVEELLQEDPDAVVNISVSFDGTWQERGLSSHYGVGACIDILTGLVIDYEVLSTYCHACVLKATAVKEKKVTEEDYKTWTEEHTDCTRNFAGSSKAMEQESAKRMWGRSVDLHQLRYTRMLSDGDGSALREVLSLDPYPGIVVGKLECVDHVHRRMGTALRKLKSAIWARCPKTGFVGKSRIEAAAGMAVATFNEGAHAVLGVMEKLWLGSTAVTLENTRGVDLLRATKAEAVASAAAKRRRKRLGSAQKAPAGTE